MKFTDAEKMVVDFLALRIAPTLVATKVPATRPATFVRAWRTGGASWNRVLDRPMVTVQAWATSSVDASQLANKCRRALFDDYMAMPLVRGIEEVSGLYFDPDPNTGIDRYTFTVQLQVRAER